MGGVVWADGWRTAGDGETVSGREVSGRWGNERV